MTRLGNSGVEKSSRMARRYAIPATASGMMKDSSPTLLTLREQSVSATNKMAPSPYSLCEGVSFTGPHSTAKLRDYLLPFSEPACSPWRLRGSELQFPSQQNQIVCDVDVVEGLREAGREFKDLRARQQSVQRTPCSHAIALEERRVSGLGANKIVASIVGWPDNHVMRGEYFERAVQNRRSEVWTVAIEGNDVLPAGGRELSKNRGESCCETFSFLRYDLHCITE
jgi:hypothetical protein